jgi:hypothetical protein
MPAPQSVSAVHAFGSQVMMTICPASPSLAQSAFGGHAGRGSVTTPDVTQE